jgi:hypothetical protein
MMHDFLQNDLKDGVDMGDDEPQDSDEEWDALLEKHQEDVLGSESPPDPADPMNQADNSMRTKSKKRLYNRVDLLWAVAWNIAASAAKQMKAGWWIFICSLDDVWVGKRECMSLMIMEPFSCLHLWSPWQAPCGTPGLLGDNPCFGLVGASVLKLGSVAAYACFVVARLLHPCLRSVARRLRRDEKCKKQSFFLEPMSQIFEAVDRS